MLLVSSCSIYRTIDYGEPLINVYGKTMNRQYIEFLEKEDSKFKITVYRYYIDPQKNVVRIGGGESLFYDLDSEYVNVKHYSTSEDFKKGVTIWAKKYFNMISPDFVNMDNREKMKVLDSLILSVERKVQ
jgi:hypothetical protein